jgi:hypothetical protein
MISQLLRRKLENITKNNSVDQQPRLIEALRKEIPHTIQIAVSELPIEKYTCIPYAFDLSNNPDYSEISKLGMGRVFASMDFVGYLLNKKSLAEKCQNGVTTNDIVLYFAQDNVMHAGKVVNIDRLISKWGIGNLYEHDLYEVPESYGNEVRFFRMLDKHKALELFLDYAEYQGIIERQ